VQTPESKYEDRIAKRELARSGVSRLLRIPETLYRVFATILLVGGCFGQIALILSRNLAGIQPAWCNVAVTLALACGGLLYIGLVPSHIGFYYVGDAITRRLPGFVLLRAIVICLILGALARAGVQAAQAQRTLGSTFASFNFHVWIALLVIPVSAAVAALRVLIVAAAYEWARLRSRGASC
jgi:hypothetical protein